VSDDQAHGATEENVARKMVAGGDARKANGGGESIREERNPAMMAVAVREHRGDGHGGHGMAGIEATRVEGIVGTVEEATGVGAVAGVGERLATAGDSFHRKVQEEAVGNSFGCQERGVFCVFILAHQSDTVNRGWDSGDDGRSIAPAESIVESAENGSGPERRSRARVGRHEGGGDPDDADGRQNMRAVYQRDREQPD
jgi:hypothetical protein